MPNLFTIIRYSVWSDSVFLGKTENFMALFNLQFFWDQNPFYLDDLKNIPCLSCMTFELPVKCLESFKVQTIQNWANFLLHICRQVWYMTMRIVASLCHYFWLNIFTTCLKNRRFDGGPGHVFYYIQ